MGAELTFSTRTGTRNGVECHLFRVERPKELTTWSHALVNGAHNAASLIKEINCGKTMLLFFKIQNLVSKCAISLSKNLKMDIFKNVLSQEILK